RALRAPLAGAHSVAVVGGGLTGCEVACAVTAMARSAVLVNSQRLLMPRSVGEPIGALITAAHLASGLDLRLGRKVADAEPRATGGEPAVDWLPNTPPALSDGVLCDASLRVVGLAGVVAAGSVARWPDRRH